MRYTPPDGSPASSRVSLAALPAGWRVLRDVTHPLDAERYPHTRVALVQSERTGIYSTWTGRDFRPVAQQWARNAAVTP